MSINQYIGKAGQKWSALTRPRKALIGGGSLIVLIGLIFLGQWLADANYAPLFSDLSTEQAGGVIDQLDEMNVSYKVAGDGDTILVPGDVLYKTRLQLASSGILEGTNKGFELFDETQLGTTDFERRLNYQRALQEELRRTIGYLEEVEAARVHLVLPEESLFIEEELPASASIVVDLKPLAELKPEQVKGIIYLVSTSVKNLPPENVNVIDTTGKILSEGVIQTEETQLGMVNTRRAEMKREFEDSLEKRVGKMLEKILGPNKAVVMITADLNFDQRQVTRIEYGEDGVVRSEELVEKSSVSTGDAGGIPGSTTNIGTYGTVQGGSQSSQTETHQTRNYEIDELQETTVYAPGQLNSLSTSVAVDGELSAEDIEQIQSIVEAGVGYQPERGDQIAVVSRSFDKTAVEQAKAQMEEEQAAQMQREQFKRYVMIGAAGLVLLIAGVLAFIFIRRRRRSPAGSKEKELYAIPLSQMEAMQEEMDKTPERLLSEEERKRKRNFDKIKEIASEKPDEAAALVRAWLTEE